MLKEHERTVRHLKKDSEAVKRAIERFELVNEQSRVIAEVMVKKQEKEG